MSKTKLKKEGFTMLELLIVVSLLGLVMVAIIELLAATLSGSSKSQNMHEVKSAGQFAISTIEKQLRSATGVTACANSALAFNIVNPEAGNTTTYSYSVDGVGILRQIKDGSDTALTSLSTQVSNFNCEVTLGTSGSPPIYKISFNIAKSSSFVQEGVAAQTFETIVSLRNY